MRIRDIFNHFCPLCWGAFIFMSLPLAPLLAFAVWVLVVTAASVASLWLIGIALGWLLMLCLSSYFEARRHWKRGESW